MTLIFPNPSSIGILCANSGYFLLLCFVSWYSTNTVIPFYKDDLQLHSFEKRLANKIIIFKKSTKKEGWHKYSRNALYCPTVLLTTLIRTILKFLFYRFVFNIIILISLIKKTHFSTFKSSEGFGGLISSFFIKWWLNNILFRFLYYNQYIAFSTTSLIIYRSIMYLLVCGCNFATSTTVYCNLSKWILNLINIATKRTLTQVQNKITYILIYDPIHQNL